MRFWYSALHYALIPLILARLAWRSRKLPAYRRRWRERFALYDFPPPASVVWFHAVSVGEAEAAFPVIRCFQARFPALPVLVTCTTPTGSERITRVLGDSVRHVYLPYDLPDGVARFLAHFRPLLGIIMETEIWPNLYRACRCRGIPLAIVNGRLSEKSARGYRKLRTLATEALDALALVAAQTGQDAERYAGIGADPDKLVVMGNVKFDLDFSETMRKQARELRAGLFGERPVWIAGSTHPGEEAQILAALAEVRRRHHDILLALAPRHPERAGEVAELCRQAGYSLRRRSENQPCDPDTGVFLLDSLGELRLFYGAADVAYVGGSLVPRGGHNVLEAAAAGVPVVFGPHTFNFADIARRLQERGGGLEVNDAQRLAQAVSRYLADPEARSEIGARGQAFIRENRGAVERVTELIAGLLPLAVRSEKACPAGDIPCAS